jgi:hypothetical protein
MNFLKHLIEQPFITATGAAALLHSTWSLGTLFTGVQPQADASNINFWGWLIPALLIAFALDVGQIATSAEIRLHGLTAARGLTFVIFAAATYYLQWLYIVHHMPSLELAGGVRTDWAAVATLIRDSAIWIIPALLPLSTLLYTFSGKNAPARQNEPAIAIAKPPVTVYAAMSWVQDNMPLLPMDTTVASAPEPEPLITPDYEPLEVVQEPVPFGATARIEGEPESTVTTPNGNAPIAAAEKPARRRKSVTK